MQCPMDFMTTPLYVGHSWKPYARRPSPEFASILFKMIYNLLFSLGQMAAILDFVAILQILNGQNTLLI